MTAIALFLVFPVAGAFVWLVRRLIDDDIARREKRFRESDERFARLILSELGPLNRLRMPRTSCASCGTAPGVFLPGGGWECGRCGHVHRVQ